MTNINYHKYAYKKKGSRFQCKDALDYSSCVSRAVHDELLCVRDSCGVVRADDAADAGRDVSRGREYGGCGGGARRARAAAALYDEEVSDAAL